MEIIWGNHSERGGVREQEVGGAGKEWLDSRVYCTKYNNHSEWGGVRKKEVGGARKEWFNSRVYCTKLVQCTPKLILHCCYEKKIFSK